MSQRKRDFSLCETVDRVLREVSIAYGMDGSLLSWQFEKHVIVNGASPFKFTTKDVRNLTLNNGVDLIEFEIEFDTTNANQLKWIKFHEMPSKKFYIITQTSMLHVGEDTDCTLWIELPPGTRKEDDPGAINKLLKVKVCCERWKDFLPHPAETSLERAFHVLALDDINVVKIMLTSKTGVAEALAKSIASKDGEIASLKEQIEHMHEQRLKQGGTLENLMAELAIKKHSTRTLEKRVTEKDGIIIALKADLAEKGRIIAGLKAGITEEEDKIEVPSSPTGGSATKKRKYKLRTPKTPKTTKSPMTPTEGSVTPQPSTMLPPSRSLPTFTGLQPGATRINMSPYASFMFPNLQTLQLRAEEQSITAVLESNPCLQEHNNRPM